MHEIPERLSKCGHEIDFVDFPEGETRRGFRRILDLRTTRQETRSVTTPGSRVRVITPGRVLAPPLDRLAASATFVPLLLRLLRRDRYDAIFLYAVPTNGWQTIMVARRFGVPVVFRAIDVSHALRDTRFSPLIKRAERFVYARANHVSANNVALREYCIQHGADPAKSTVNYPGVDFEHFADGSGRQEIRKKLGFSESDRVIVYMGTFFRFSGLDKLITDFVAERSEKSRTRLLLVGDGELREEMEKIVGLHNLYEDVVMTGTVSYGDLPRYLASADVAVAPFVPSLVSHNALPWKVVQYVAAGLPVVATRLDGLSGLFPEGNGVLYADSATDVWHQVNRILSGDIDVTDLVASGQMVVRAKCDWSKSVRDFTQILESVSSEGHRQR